MISHLLGMCARFDQTGQTAVWAGFASKMGLASGPMLFSFIVGVGNYSALIAMALVLLRQLFGQSTAAFDAREIQLSLKLTF